MNREILFKAKRKDNGEWVEGNLITNERNENQKYIGYIFDERNGVIEDFDLVEVIPTTICQYTGLTVPVPEIYGEIKRKPDGTLYTTEAQRTGCSMCGFGIHMEKRPHRFDKLRERNEKEWEFWMYNCCTDAETGEKFGWGKVLDYIGVEWEDIPETSDIPGQMSIEDFL